MSKPLRQHPPPAAQCQAAPEAAEDSYLRALLRLFAALACRLR
jgi:hypothetical protein